MPQLNVTLRSGEQRAIDAQPGQTLKEALIAGGISEIDAISNCGGCCSCGTCHVYVAPADLARIASMAGQEDDLLESRSDRMPTSRLSCQIRLTEDLDGFSLTVAPE